MKKLYLVLFWITYQIMSKFVIFGIAEITKSNYKYTEI